MERIRLGYPDAALHEASAAAVARVLEAHELEVDYVPVAAAAVADALADTDDAIDLFASAWLPLTDAALLAPGRMRPLGVLYRPAFLWCVAAGGPATIADLAADASMDRRILVPEAAPWAALADRALGAYGLAAAGYAVVRVADEEAAAWAEAADPTRIVPLCRPHHLLHASGLRALEDPLAALGAEQEARLLIRHDLQAELDRDLIDELEALMLGNRVVNAMAYAMRIEGMSAEAAADAWQRGKLTPRA